MIIGFAGKKQSGKTQAAAFLVERGFVRYSFAQPLKEMAWLLLRRLGLSDDEMDAVFDDKEGLVYPIETSMRHVLQTLGTEWGREQINPGLWLMCAETFFEQHAGLDVVVDDLRFENEATLIRRLGGLVVHIDRETGLTDGHVSEAGLGWRPSYDAVIVNNGSLSAFKRQVLDFLDAGVP